MLMLQVLTQVAILVCLILLLLYTPQEAHLFLTSYTVVFLLMEIGFKAIFLFFYESFLSNN